MADKENYGIEKEEVEVKERGLFDFMKSEEEEALVTKVERINIEDGGKKDEVKFCEAKEVEKEDPVKVFGDEKYGEEKKESLLDKLCRSDSSSSSSSDEEEYEEVDGEKRKKKKKGLKEKIKERLHGAKKDAGATAAAGEEDNTVVVEKLDEPIYDKPIATPSENYQFESVSKVEDPSYKVENLAAPEEKKGFLEKIKEKLPGVHHKKDQVVEATYPPAAEAKETAYPPPAVKETSYPPPAAEETPYTPPADYDMEKKVEESVLKADATPAEEPEEYPPAEGKKGLLEKIKEKLPGAGQQKKPAEEAAAADPASPPAVESGSKDHHSEGDGKEKKGLLGKIMEKLPGYNRSSGTSEKKESEENDK